MKLNVEQRKIVELEPSGHMLIKGVAGSGKTTVAIRRIPFLVNHYCFEENDNVLLITFNKTLRNFIKYQYGKIEDNEQISFKDIMFNKDVDVKIITIDSIMYSCFSKYLKEKGLTLKISSKKDEYKAFSKSINLCSEKFPDIKILNPKYGLFLMDEVNWINSCNIIDVDIYQNIDRIGRTSGNKNYLKTLGQEKLYLN
jgi:superfamily I DNA/RNA helicase